MILGCLLGICQGLFAVEMGDSLRLQDLLSEGKPIHSKTEKILNTEQEILFFLDAAATDRMDDYFAMISEYQNEFHDLKNPVNITVVLLNGTG